MIQTKEEMAREALEKSVRNIRDGVRELAYDEPDRFGFPEEIYSIMDM